MAGRNKTAAPVFCITEEMTAMREEKVTTSREVPLPTKSIMG